MNKHPSISAPSTFSYTFCVKQTPSMRVHCVMMMVRKGNHYLNLFTEKFVFALSKHITYFIQHDIQRIYLN